MVTPGGCIQESAATAVAQGWLDLTLPGHVANKLQWGCDLQTSTLVWRHWLCHRNILMCWCVPISLLGHNLYVLAQSVEPQPVAPWKDPLANQLPKYHKSHPVWLAAPCKWLLLAWLCNLHILENKNVYSGIKPQFRVTCPRGKC